MRSPPAWKKLASELLEHGIESTYLARVEARVRPEQQLESLELEIAQEMAGALGRTEDRLNIALAELELREARFRRALTAQISPAERTALIREHDEQRAVAQARLRDLVIHREAVGFRRNQIVYELFPIPPRLEDRA